MIPETQVGHTTSAVNDGNISNVGTSFFGAQHAAAYFPAFQVSAELEGSGSRSYQYQVNYW